MYYPQSQDNDENDFNVSKAYADGTGNIQSIVRNGLVDVNSQSGVKTFGLMDDLSFNYIGGQLASVTESANGSFGFRGSGGNFSYEYGRMTQGPGLGQATYNPMGLPSTVVSPEGDQLLVKYDAEGVKWYQRKVWGSYVPPAYGISNGIEEKVYSFGLESINGEYLVSYFDHGRTIIDQAGNREAIEYYLKDHLGNIRVVFSDLDNDGEIDTHPQTEEVLETTTYYPFGMEMEGLNALDQSEVYQPLGYNGKERMVRNVLDYGARMYIAPLGRWNAVDPKADHPNQIGMSPYSAMWNNPIYWTDPDGLCPYCPDEVYVPIADHVYGAQVGDITSNGWEVVRVDHTKSGYQGALYKGTYNDKTEYIYATAGTQDFRKDGVANVEQVFGASRQYQESVSLAEGLSSEYAGVSFTGHSLGGGLASANALATEGKAVTFNAAGLSGGTKSKLNLNNKSANITACIVSGEGLDVFQRKVGLRAEGNRLIFLPGVGRNAIDKHMMQNVKTAFDIWQSIINDANTRTFNMN